MITVSEAKSIILANTPSDHAFVSLSAACGLTLEKDVLAAFDIPNYRQSSMDGYAFRISDLNRPLRIIGESSAGTDLHLRIQEHEAVRIFTGAPVPEGADTVVMQEKISVADNQVSISDEAIKIGANIRERGAEITAGSIAMRAHSTLTVGAIGFLASIGVEKVSVFRKPVVSIITTGNELQSPGTEISYGKVFDSNSIALSAALKQGGIDNVPVYKVGDDLEQLSAILATALVNSDIVLLSGGVSVGDYDYVIKAAERCDVQTRFHRIKQKPGKPLFFGTKESKMVFGLPGNPSSSLTCFYIYVLPAIEKFQRRKNSIIEGSAILQNDYKKGKGLTHFVKAKVLDGSVSILNAQESFRLYSFAQANSIVELSEEREEYVQGEQVKLYLLPG